MDTGRGEERVRCMERVAQITICKINSQWEFAVWQINQGLCINLDRWDGEGDGREVQKGGIHVYLWLIHVEV